MKISELQVGMRRVNIVGRVIEKSEEREVFSRFDGKPHRVATAIIEDDSGSIPLSLWDDKIDMVNVNDVIRIENGYVTSFRGRPQLNIGRYGKLKVEQSEI